MQTGLFLFSFWITRHIGAINSAVSPIVCVFCRQVIQHLWKSADPDLPSHRSSILWAAGCLFHQHCWPAWPREESWNHQNKVEENTPPVPNTHFLCFYSPLVFLLIQRWTRKSSLRITTIIMWIMRPPNTRICPQTGTRCLILLGTSAGVQVEGVTLHSFMFLVNSFTFIPF